METSQAQQIDSGLSIYSEKTFRLCVLLPRYCTFQATLPSLALPNLHFDVFSLTILQR